MCSCFSFLSYALVATFPLLRPQVRIYAADIDSQDLLNLNTTNAQMQQELLAVKEAPGRTADSIAATAAAVTKLGDTLQAMRSDIDKLGGKLDDLIKQSSDTSAQLTLLRTDTSAQLTLLRTDTSAQFTLLRTEVTWQFRLLCGLLLLFALVRFALTLASAVGK
jgi:septal ring factor EnvC (AmiA/AmiB activator)